MITLAHFQHVIDFHNYLMAYENSHLVTDCFKILGLCSFPYHIVDYFKDFTGNAIFPGALANDAALVALVNSATNPILGNKVTPGSIFGGSIPTHISQDHTTPAALYNYQSATAISCGYFTNANETFYKSLEKAAHDFLVANSLSDVIDISVFSSKLLQDEIKASAMADSIYMILGAVLLIAYAIIFVSTCHPIGFRSTTVLVGLLTAVCSTLSAYGLCSAAGLSYTSYHTFIFLFVGLLNLFTMHLLTAHADQINPLSSIQ